MGPVAIFLFGTLLDGDVLRKVIGAVDQEASATLFGFRRVGVGNGSWPALLPDPVGRADGLLVVPKSPDALDRLRWFEGPLQPPVLHPVTTAAGEVVEAWVCMTAPGLALTDEPWDFEAWRRRHKDRYLVATRRYMARFGLITIEEAMAGWRRDMEEPTD